MIARIWRGAVRTDDADEYAQYIRDTGFAEYGRTDGNRGAWMLRRDDGGETEFLTLSMWDSREAIKAFAGEDIEAAVLYPEDEKYLIGESTIAHYDVVDQRLGHRGHAVGAHQQRRAAEDAQRPRGDRVEPAHGDRRASRGGSSTPPRRGR